MIVPLALYMYIAYKLFKKRITSTATGIEVSSRRAKQQMYFNLPPYFSILRIYTF